MNRRQFLLGVGATGISATGLTAWHYWPEQGFINPCHEILPVELAGHELVTSAWQGIDSHNVWDSHAHLLGTGDSGGGSWLNPDMDSLLHPTQFAQKRFFMNAGCAGDMPQQVDQHYIDRMRHLINGMRAGHKLLLLAFEHNYNINHAMDLEHSAFYTPNNYASKIAQSFPHHFEWAASIHPYRTDSVTALDDAVKKGARAIKWLPAAMGIDPGSKLCDSFYQALVKHDLPLITHAGKERAVHGANTQHYGNPLKLRRALDHGVRIVIAHCATMGEDHDLDQGENGPMTESFLLFSRLMEEHRYEKILFADISAITQVNRARYVKSLLGRSEWHSRLLNGSDYPLPGVMPLFSLDLFVEMELLDRAAVPVLTAIRTYNSLLFDFVLKRHLSTNNQRFSPHIFETRGFFMRSTL